MPRRSTPTARASDGKKRVERVKRKYTKRVNINKSKEIRPGEVEFVENMTCTLKLARYSNTQIAQVIGIGRNQVAEILERPHVTEMLVKLQKSVPEAALGLMEGFAIEAVTAIVDVMRTAEDDKIVLQAAADILDRTGLPKSSKQERKSEHEEKMTFSADALTDKLRQASPEIQERAAQMIEGLEELLSEASEAPVEIEDADE